MGRQKKRQGSKTHRSGEHSRAALAAGQSRAGTQTQATENRRRRRHKQSHQTQEQEGRRVADTGGAHSCMRLFGFLFFVSFFSFCLLFLLSSFRFWSLLAFLFPFSVVRCVMTFEYFVASIVLLCMCSSCLFVSLLVCSPRSCLFALFCRSSCRICALPSALCALRCSGRVHVLRPHWEGRRGKK